MCVCYVDIALAKRRRNRTAATHTATQAAPLFTPSAYIVQHAIHVTSAECEDGIPPEEKNGLIRIPPVILRRRDDSRTMRLIFLRTMHIAYSNSFQCLCKYTC